MATKREYLIGLGLAKPTRGRLSREALAEVERARADGMTFDDDESVQSENSADLDIARMNVPVAYPPLYSPPKIRDITAMNGFTPEGYKISSTYCSRCTYHVSRCPCRGGVYPTKSTAKWADDSKEYGQPLDPPVRA